MNEEMRPELKAWFPVFRVTTNTCLEPLNHNQNTHNNNYAARIPRVRTEAGKKAFWFQGPKLFNELPSSLCQLDSLLIFKQSLKQFYMDS